MCSKICAASMRGSTYFLKQVERVSGIGEEINSRHEASLGKV